MSKLTKEELITLKSYEINAHAWSNAHMTQNYWGEDMGKFQKMLPQGKLLEIGSGGGRDAKELIALGYDYTGTDISGELLEIAKSNNPKAKFIQCSVYDLDFKQKFDGFWCAAVLLHIPRARIDEALQAIKRNISPDAVGYIAVKEGNGERIEKSTNEQGGDRFFTYWKNDDFQKVIDRNGFDIIHSNFRPISDKTKWLTYLVKNSRK